MYQRCESVILFREGRVGHSQVTSRSLIPCPFLGYLRSQAPCYILKKPSLAASAAAASVAACDWLQDSSALAGEAVSHHYINCVHWLFVCSEIK